MASFLSWFRKLADARAVKGVLYRLETYLIVRETLIGRGKGGRGKRFTLVLDMPHPNVNGSPSQTAVRVWAHFSNVSELHYLSNARSRRRRRKKKKEEEERRRIKKAVSVTKGVHSHQ